MTGFIQILTGTLGTLGFAVLFHLRGKKLLFATLGGLLSWAVFLAFEPLYASEAVRYLISSTAITLYAEVLARVEKTPTTTFLVPSFIPLIPGGALYYTMNYALNQQWHDFAKQAFYTLQLALSLAIGIIAVTTLSRILHAALTHKRQQTK